ncbi:hypothetical protein M231_00678 [Tremella mesenterica]|uniref:Uncharacterized protein n=1 Tax=Tremella mesenterica TaxID=5217 RepID=A0A4V1M4Y2_TREME|nr:hypothetical protein M231_00678 [Tremella mesenterica]
MAGERTESSPNKWQWGLQTFTGTDDNDGVKLWVLGDFRFWPAEDLEIRSTPTQQAPQLRRSQSVYTSFATTTSSSTLPSVVFTPSRDVSPHQTSHNQPTPSQNNRSMLTAFGVTGRFHDISGLSIPPKNPELRASLSQISQAKAKQHSEVVSVDSRNDRSELGEAFDKATAILDSLLGVKTLGDMDPLQANVLEKYAEDLEKVAGVMGRYHDWEVIRERLNSDRHGGQPEGSGAPSGTEGGRSNGTPRR